MMENDMTMTPEQKAARLQLIKQVAEKRKARAEFKRKQAINAATVRRWTDEVEKPKRRKANNDIDRMIEKFDENHNQWTDAPQYAETYYGDVMRETTKFDNDWN
jgi:hypothetical protein